MPSETKQCQNCKENFTIDPEDFSFYEKVKVPPPTWCWKCRAIRRMAFRNMRHLYARTCDATGEKIFTFIPPGSPMPVYEAGYWRSDNWDPLTYGREYDFSRPFFDQIRDLYNEVPWGIMWTMEMVDCNYSVSAFSKNCYLCFDSGYDEDSAYNITLLYSKKCFDGLNVKDCELCYYCLNTTQSYKTFFSRNCVSCVDVWFSYDCVGCTNCLGCSGMRNKSYCMFNEQLDKETYEAKLADMKLDSWSGVEKAREQAEAVWLRSPVKYRHGVQTSHSEGDYLNNGTDLFSCFFVGNAQNMRYCQSVIYPPNKDSMDVTSSEGTELAYETTCCGGVTRKTFAVAESRNATDSEYSINCIQIGNVFGCVALKSKEYCILNKQYSKEEYRKLLPKIKQHMNDMPYTDALGRVYKYGEFFPPDINPCGYAQTQAFEYFPMVEKEAMTRGFHWRAPEERAYTITKKAHELPDSILDTTDEVFKEVIQCQHEGSSNHSFGCDINCAGAFRITKQEFDFYKQMSLPLPRLCFNCRHVDRVRWRNVPALYSRECMCDYEVYKNSTEHRHHPEGRCPNEFQTSYSPERPEIVYCEQCYQAEVI